MFYAIEVIGYGKRRRYVLRRVISKSLMAPTDGKAYATEAAAREAAAGLGYHVKMCGDLWEIIAEVN